jgi:penicillin-binding protein 2
MSHCIKYQITRRNNLKPKTSEQKENLRYNLLTMFIYIVGIILIVQLFSFQIIHGKEYRETSNNRLTRETTITAARGQILDTSGRTLVGNKMSFRVELYKTKIEYDTLNQTILKLLNLLEKNGDTYVDTFPIKLNPIEYTFSSEEQKVKWLSANDIGQTASAEEAFNVFKEKYNIISDSNEAARKIIVVRYRITNEGYSNARPLIISKSISRVSMLEIEEKSSEFPAIGIVDEPIRYYLNGKLASHIVRIYRENKR